MCLTIPAYWAGGEMRRPRVSAGMRGARIAVVVLLLCGLMFQACGANPGDPINLDVRNNTGTTVTVRACNGYAPSCSSTAYTVQLRPGQTSTTAQEPDGTFRPMMVASSQGSVLGCLPFQFSVVPPANDVVKVSEMVPCGDSLGKGHSGGHDWPYRNY
jgi:hypothetical protein